MDRLGEGAFGSVFLAEQSEPVRRRVALKVLKRGMDTRAVLRRFDAEKQALAMMDHAGIATVFDAGVTAHGLPYFVMELVQGEPITRYCDRRRLAISDRIGLFIKVCRALQHAHQKGIIHRDIKPSNVLVAKGEAGEGQPKVIDFGVAKATQEDEADAGMHTRVGQPIGTPLYMSPEQTGGVPGGVDTRSDIYSLGVLLYELLTGETPIDRTRYRTVQQQLKLLIEGGPGTTRPSTRFTLGTGAVNEAAERRQTDASRLQRRLRGDLDWIVMKCLEVDPARRYDTASALADDLARHLAHEPVLAGRPSTAYTVSKFLRRRWPQVAVAAVLTLSLVVGLIGTMIGYREASVRSQRLQATLDFFSATLAGRASDEPVTTSFADTPSVTLGEALRTSGADIGESFADAPELAAVVRELVGLAQLRAGNFEDAARQFRLAYEAGSTGGEGDGSAVRLLLPLAESLVRSGKLDEAIATAEAAYEAGLARQGPTSPATRAAALWAGRWHSAAYEFDEAERFLSVASNADIEDGLAFAAESERVHVLIAAGDLADAESLARRLFEDTSPRSRVQTVDRARLARYLGYVYLQMARPDDAIAVLTSNFSVTTADDGSDRLRRRLLAWSHAMAGDVPQAITELESLLRLEGDTPGPVYREIFVRVNLADVFLLAERGAEAFEQTSIALSKYHAASLPADPDLTWAYTVHARALLGIGRTEDALEAIDSAAGVAANYPEHRLYTASLSLTAALIHESLRDREAAVRYAKSAARAAEQMLRVDHPTRLQTELLLRRLNGPFD